MALIGTLYGFSNFIKLLKKDINILLEVFDKKISKGIYETLKTKMDFIEFEKLKESINKAVNAIKYYKDEMIKRYYYNPITNLPNRMKLLEDMKNTYKNALVIFNINKFRKVNDWKVLKKIKKF